jgi:hypothetical protein
VRPLHSCVPRGDPSFDLALVLLGATLFIVNAGVSRVALPAGVAPVTLHIGALALTGGLAVVGGIVLAQPARRVQAPVEPPLVTQRFRRPVPGP